MPNLTKAKATICIVNYKTLNLTRLCLRSIRKFTEYPYEVIVVDNNSHDASLDYLRRLDWIRLIERQPESNESGGQAHGAALDLGLKNCQSEFFVSVHSDTIIQKPGWLTELISYFDEDENAACVGSGKIEYKPNWRVFLQKITDLKALQRKLFADQQTLAKYRYYNRTICCVYRTEILSRERLSFLMGKGQGLAVGQKLYFELVERGYKTVELSADVMKQYIVHLAHATQVINPKEFRLQKRASKKYNRLDEKLISSALVQSILIDDSLDT
jgi:glycosyltransferase involved in cell wall biosynthesis